jgi:hypothetical protein
MIPLPSPPSKPQCRHHNDADDCLLCGTRKNKRSYNVNLDAPGLDRGPQFDPTYCHEHKTTRPCFQCEAEREVRLMREREHQRVVDAINTHSIKLWDQFRREQHNIRWPGGKCVHGHYLSESYCHVCSLALVDPDYNPNVYRTEITKALANAKQVLGGVARSVRNTLRDEAGNLVYEQQAEGEKNFAEIEMIVDLEIWKTTKKYGDKMTAALAYTIARNTAQKFLANLITEQTIFTGLNLEFATTKDREDAERLLAQCDSVQALELLANDWRADANDRKTARHLINEYGERRTRFSSIDDTREDEEGEPNEAPAEVEVVQKEERETACAPDVADTFEAHRPALAALVATWRGDQKKVGEAMLAPGFSVRSVPGVDKSKVSRIYPVVVRAFKTLIQNQLQNK